MTAIRHVQAAAAPYALPRPATIRQVPKGKAKGLWEFRCPHHDPEQRWFGPSAELAHALLSLHKDCGKDGTA